MEDAFTRQHAQYLVAAVVAVGARVVGRAVERLRLRPMFVDLHALGVTHSPQTAAALRRAARSAVRTALGEGVSRIGERGVRGDEVPWNERAEALRAPGGVGGTRGPSEPARQPSARAVPPTIEEPHAVQLTPIDGGYRVRVLLGAQRPPLQPYELTDLQVAWARAQQRELGPARSLPSPQEIGAREAEVDAAIDHLRETHKRLVAGEPAVQAELADAMNRAQVATDALRAAVRRANPLQPQRRTYADTLTFAVKAEGLEALPLIERDRVMRDAFARAAGLSDPGELRVTTRPTRREGESLVRVDFNLRNERARGPEHLNPDSLRDAILSGAAALPSAPAKLGAAAAEVAIQAIEVVRRPLAHEIGPDPLVAAMPAVEHALHER